MKKSLTLAIAIGLAMPTGSALAGDQISLRYNDLNLESAAGQATLERRIAAVADKYCGTSLQRTGSRLTYRSTEKCVAETRAKLGKQVAAAAEQQRLGG